MQRTKRAVDHVPAKLVQDMEDMVSWRGMKKQGWTIKNSACYINITLKYMNKETRDSIGPLTDYVGPGDVVHCVIEGYEVTRMGNKQQNMSCTYTQHKV